MDKKIVFYTENYVFGGGNKYLVDLINGAPDDVSLKILTNKNGFFEGDQKRLKKGCTVISIKIFNNRFLTDKLKKLRPRFVGEKIAEFFLPIIFLLNYLKLLIWLKRVKPSLVVSCNGGFPGAESTIAMAFAAKTLGIPVVMSVVSIPMKRRKFLWLYDYFLDCVIKRAVSKIVLNSKVQIAQMCQLRGLSEKKMLCLYNGIDYLERLERNYVDRTDHQFILGYVGRLDKLKGVEYVLKAIKQCNNPNIKFIVIGDGPELCHLKDLANRLAIQNQVEFRGFVKESITNIHKEFDVFVLPSLWEGLPYSILEAMRSGLPIISTNVGGIPEAIDHMESGILVEPADVKKMAGAIDYMKSHFESMQLFSNKGRSKFEREFTLNVMERKFQTLLDGYLKSKTKIQ